MATPQRVSSYTQASTSMDQEQPKNGDTEQKDMWSSMLDNVASGKKLPEKSVLILGGNPETQKEFLESLSTGDMPRKGHDRKAGRQPPIANNFALGYTYHDVLDADQEDTLARLSLYLLADPSPSFVPLLRPLLTPQTIPNTLIVILLDWTQPWSWMRQVRDWVRLLRTLLVSLDADCKEKMEEVMISWRDRGRGGVSLDGGASGLGGETDVSLPLGPGEWEEALGLPLCVVCQNSDRIESLERERGWKEEEFDFVLQFLRSVLLKHGASLIYTMPSSSNSLQSLIHSSLGIQSLLKRQPLKHNVIDRDKVLVPPNWDSWGKIRVLREGFDVEGVNNGWSIDIQEASFSGDGGDEDGLEEHYEEGSALAVYEETIRDPRLDALHAVSNSSNGHTLEVESLDVQAFLASQLEVLDRITKASATGPTNGRRDDYQNNSVIESTSDTESSVVEDGRVNEHIGPVQFNMGGIQVDADDMLQRLKDRQSYQTPEPSAPSVSSPDGSKNQNEALASFFAGLMKRGGNSAASSPRPGS